MASLADMVWANADRFGGTIGLRRRTDGSWLDVTTREFAARVLDVAKGLIAAGLRPGEKVAILAGTRFEWTLFDYAVWTAGCQTVPVDPAAAAEDIEWILSDSGASAIVLETGAHRAMLRRMVDRLPELRRIWRLDGDATVAPAVAELTALGAGIDDATAHERRLAVGADTVATLDYPVGTAHAKRVEHTHGELLGRVRATIDTFGPLLRAGSSLLVLLPLSDPAARLLSLACVYTRTTLGHVPDAGNLITDLGTFRPRTVVAGSALLCELHDAARERAAVEGRSLVFDAAEAVAVEFGGRRHHSLALRLKHALADAVVYPKLRATFGGRCVAALVTGEPLELARRWYYRGIGIAVHELAEEEPPA